MEWSNETILRFLYLYKQYSVIWDPKHSEHKNKTTVAIAWQNLAENLNMGISVIDLKKKKDALMATYRHQQKKVQLARANGENYKPTWFCYYAMNNFLHDIYKPTGIPKGDFSDNQENNNYEEVAAILGIAGGCRREELQKMTTDDIEDNGSVLVVQIPETITTKPRSFVVSGKSELNIINIYRKYVSLRPRFVQSNRVFVHFHKGKCTEQVVGANTLAKIPSEIATFLGLPNPTEYTGHCFRRSSLNLLNDTGANILTVNNSWKNSSTVDGMINSTTSEIAVTQNLEKEDQIQCDSPKIKEEPKTFFEHSNFEFEDFELPEPEEPVEEKPFIRKKRKMSSETKSQTDLEILPHTYTVPNIQMDSLDKVQEKDEISLFTELLATKLRKLDSTSRIIICNKIDNMMFEAELKLLQENKTRLDPLTQDVPTTSVESVEKKVLSSQSSPAGSEESASSE